MGDYAEIMEDNVFREMQGCPVCGEQYEDCECNEEV
jgi:hypothetical protein